MACNVNIFVLWSLFTCSMTSAQFPPSYRIVHLEEVPCQDKLHIDIAEYPVVIQLGFRDVFKEVRYCKLKVVSRGNYGLALIIHSLDIKPSSHDYLKFSRPPKSSILSALYKYLPFLDEDTPRLRYQFSMDLSRPYVSEYGRNLNTFRTVQEATIKYEGGSGRANNFSIVVTPYILRGEGVTECREGELSCSAGHSFCVDDSLRCDGVVNCPIYRARDEYGCNEEAHGVPWSRLLSWLLLALTLLLVCTFGVSCLVSWTRRRRRPLESIYPDLLSHHRLQQQRQEQQYLDSIFPLPLRFPLMFRSSRRPDGAAEPACEMTQLRRMSGDRRSATDATAPPSYDKLQGDELAALPKYSDLYPRTSSQHPAPPPSVPPAPSEVSTRDATSSSCSSASTTTPPHDLNA